jgi:hypothetical protein
MDSKQTEAALREKEQKLVKSVYRWLKRIGGLVFAEDQIEITIRIRKRMSTSVLTEADWENLLNQRYWDWSKNELAFLKKIKKDGNKGTKITEDYQDIARYNFVSRMQTLFRRRRSSPFYFSATKLCSVGQIRKYIYPRVSMRRTA